MRKFRHIFLLVAVLLGTGACSKTDDPQASLDIYIRFPDQSQTKAGTDVDPDNEKETRIIDLRIWVFDSAHNDKPLGFLAPTKLDYSGETVHKFTILLDKEKYQFRPDIFRQRNHVCRKKKYLPIFPLRQL